MKTEIFDVLIVYSHLLATSANSLKDLGSLPFAKGSKNESYNLVYAYFLKICQKYGLKIAFTTSGDIIGPGKCQGYWLYQNDYWKKVKKQAFSKLIFDKFSPVTKKIKESRYLLFSSPKTKSFNEPSLFDLFFDKQKMYKRLHQFSIPTVTITKSTIKDVNLACMKLKEFNRKHPHKKDFSNDIVMKDRFGAGGINVYKFKMGQARKMLQVLKKYNRKSFIIQSFVEFDSGFNYKNSLVSADVRIIYLEGEIVQTYIRMAKPDDFRCNEHQGGILKYVPKREIPKNIMIISELIAKKLNKSSLFALDFITSNNGNVYLLEGNTGPGLDWNLNSNENKIEAQKLIRIIAKELVKLSGHSNIIKRKSQKNIINTSVTDEFSPPLTEPMLA